MHMSSSHLKSAVALIFTLLGEASATQTARGVDAHGFKENEIASKQGGHVAGSASNELQAKTGRAGSTKVNYKTITLKRNAFC